MYVLVRKDLSYSQIVVQVAHATIEATKQFVRDEIEHPHLVVCETKNLKDLLTEAERLDKIRVRNTVFYEDDIGGLPTALATEIIYGETRKTFKHWKLLRN